jgi:hypothetical protein
MARALLLPLALAAGLGLGQTMLTGTMLTGTTLTGVLDDWRGGAAVIEAVGFDGTGDHVTLASGNVTPDGHFALELPTPTTLDFSPGMLECRFGTFGGRELRVALVMDFLLRQDGVPVGAVRHVSAAPNAPSFAVIAYVYVAEALVASDLCMFQGAVGFSVALEPGWNTLLLTPLSNAGEVIGMLARSFELPEETTWRYDYAPHDPAPHDDAPPTPEEE